MAISQSRYVNITSGVGAGAGEANRHLGGRFFSENPLIPTNTVLEFTNLADVATYFNTTSTEYLRASYYFGWVSKNITAPSLMSFWRWANVAVASTIYGAPGSYTVSGFTSITTGDFTLTLGGFTDHLTGINLSAAGSLTTVASDIQAAIRAYSAGGTAWTAATVTYDATRKCFDLVSGLTGDDTIAVVAGVTTDVAGPLGWLVGAILSNGQAAQTITNTLNASSSASNNFGSFTFIPSLTLSQVTEAATWNDSLDVTYMYSVAVTPTNSSTWSPALAGFDGTTLTLAPLTTEYPEQFPMMIMDATDYTRVNSVQNYMFQQSNLTPSVTNNGDANTYDALSINYYGQTQQAGQLISFYQRGVMMGQPTDPLDQNTYANEVWLKDAIGAAIMTLLLAVAQVPANNAGRLQLLTIIQGIVNLAVANGTISVGKPLTDTQKSYITTVSGNNATWQQVQNLGYWLDLTIEPYIENSTTKYKAVYTLIYSKDDVIRLVEGSDILI